MRVRLPQQMLAAAIADFEPDIVDRLVEIASRIAAFLDVQDKPRQQRFAQCKLVRRELGSFAPAEQVAAMALGPFAVHTRKRA